ncbi:MAG: hypothetical protein H6779_02370 [Candidatus Nomurabacteria bacterium]|nr:MAG: hypothetical protein H6779_02370 [Candidatus Nomurabacteria bacterium]
MKVVYKINADLIATIKEDLSRFHPYAFERIGFISNSCAYTSDDTLTIYALGYTPIPDDCYIPDYTVGVRFGKDAIQKALELAFNEGGQNVSVFHVHEHMGSNVPWFSQTDLLSADEFVPDIFNTAPAMPHGILVLNERHASGKVWTTKAESQPIETVISVGSPTKYSNYHERTLF